MPFSKVPAKANRNPKNRWTFKIVWMSGDADDYKTVKYTFKSEKAFEAAYLLVSKILDFARRHHNVFCDITQRNSIKSVLTAYSSRSKYDKQVTVDIKKLFGTYEALSDLLASVDIEDESDVTSDGQFSACPTSIKDLTYFDALGKEFKLKPKK